ncbi:cytochrome c oxidase subunit 3 [Algivirga pacifica]|uniref:Cytochrome c oxidase subunit 3 n=1 Tax=Algivirga pacifica TaxID=1162670 RepID=A0ABP9D9Z1_9BACT
MEQMMTDQPQRTFSVHPKKFAMWLFIVSITMIFAAFTSAYIVRQAEGNWFEFELPMVFYYSTAVIVASSATMFWAMRSAKKDNFSNLKIAIVITAILGAIFLVLQVIGWQHLVEVSAYFVGNPSGSFVYVITGVHGLHVVSAVVYLFVILFAVFKMEIHSKALVRLEMCATYWHFLDILWVYLFFFLLFNR